MPLSASSPRRSIIPCFRSASALAFVQCLLTHLRHNSLTVLAFDVLERHLHALGGGDLDARAVHVRDLSKRDYDKC